MSRALPDVNRARITSILLVGCAAAAILAVSPPPPAAASAVPAATVPAATLRAATGADCPSSGGSEVADAPQPAGEIKIYGHGWGHGMGMSQYGAQGAARLGCGYRTILTTYYTDTAVRRRSLRGRVVLKLAASARRSSLYAESGPVTWYGSSGSAVRSIVQPRGSTWTVTLQSDDGTPGAAVLDGSGQQKLFVRKGVPLTAAHSGTIVIVRPSTASSTTLRTRYDAARFLRTGDALGVTEMLTTDGTRTAVQKYLAGLAEVPASWPAEALKAQAVAARTYLTAKFSSTERVFKVSITTADQVYSGYRREAADLAGGGHWRDAVDATDSEVVLGADHRPIEAMYSSSMGGYTENRQYVYGRYGISYLKAVDDSRWDAASDNPYRSWSRGFSKASFASRFGFDTVTAWQIGERGSEIRVDSGVKITGAIRGQTVTKEFTGAAARYRLGLKSPGFTFAGGTSIG